MGIKREIQISDRATIDIEEYTGEIEAVFITDDGAAWKEAQLSDLTKFERIVVDELVRQEKMTERPQDYLDYYNKLSKEDRKLQEWKDGRND